MEKTPPTASNGIIDSHAHVVKEYFKDDQDEVIDRAHDLGVTTLINPSVVVDDIPELRELSRKHEWIYVAAGQHPHEAKHWTADSSDIVGEALKEPKFVAVGECGLDFYYNNSDHESQMRVFREQIRLARTYNKALIVHCRDAWEEAIDAIASEGQGEVRGVLHCFTGNPSLMDDIRKLDLYVSYSGIVTFPNAKDIQATVPMVASNRILVETDCPFLAPQKMRGKRNEPSFVWWTADKLATLRGCSLDEVAENATANARELFQLKA